MGVVGQKLFIFLGCCFYIFSLRAFGFSVLESALVGYAAGKGQLNQLGINVNEWTLPQNQFGTAHGRGHRKHTFAMHFINLHEPDLAHGQVMLTGGGGQASVSVLSVSGGELGSVSESGILIHKDGRGRDVELISESPSEYRQDRIRVVVDTSLPAVSHTLSVEVPSCDIPSGARAVRLEEVLVEESKPGGEVERMIRPRTEESASFLAANLRYYLASLESYIDAICGYFVQLLPPEQFARQNYLSGEKGGVVACGGDYFPCNPVDPVLRASHYQSWLEMTGGSSCEGRQCARHKKKPKPISNPETSQPATESNDQKGTLDDLLKAVRTLGDVNDDGVVFKGVEKGIKAEKKEVEQKTEPSTFTYGTLEPSSGVHSALIKLVNAVIRILKASPSQEPQEALKSAQLLTSMLTAAIYFYEQDTEQKAKAEIESLYDFLDENQLLFLADQETTQNLIVTYYSADHAHLKPLVEGSSPNALATPISPYEEWLILRGMFEELKKLEEDSFLERYLTSSIVFTLRMFFYHTAPEDFRRSFAVWLDQQATASRWREYLYADFDTERDDDSGISEEPPSSPLAASSHGGFTIQTLLSGVPTGPMVSTIGSTVSVPPQLMVAGAPVTLAQSFSQATAPGPSNLHHDRPPPAYGDGESEKEKVYRQDLERFRSLSQAQRIELMRKQHGRKRPHSQAGEGILARALSSPPVSFLPFGYRPPFPMPMMRPLLGSPMPPPMMPPVQRPRLNGVVSRPNQPSGFPMVVPPPMAPGFIPSGQRPPLVPIPPVQQPRDVFWELYHEAYSQVRSENPTETGKISAGFRMLWESRFIQLVQERTAYRGDLTPTIALLSQRWFLQHRPPPGVPPRPH